MTGESHAGAAPKIIFREDGARRKSLWGSGPAAFAQFSEREDQRRFLECRLRPLKISGDVSHQIQGS